MKIALVGSRTFPYPSVAPQLALFLSRFPKARTTVATRGSEGFDSFIGEMAKVMDYEVAIYPGKGGASNYERDVKLVAEVDRVYAFFDPDTISEGGTQHIVEKALDAKKPVESYTVYDRKLVLIGSSEEKPLDENENSTDD